jgi:hypothetical protein
MCGFAAREHAVDDGVRARHLAVAVGPCIAKARQPLRPPATHREAGEPGAEHDQREGDAEHVDRDEGYGRHGQQEARLQRAPADAQHRFDHHREDGRLQPEEQRGHDRHRPEAHVDPAQHAQHQRARQHEQRTRHDPAPGAMQQPADVHRQLLRLRARQQHAVVERVQEARLADPAPLLDQFAMHQRDLPRRPAEAQPADPPPQAQGFGEGHRVRRSGRRCAAIGQCGHP